MTKDTRIKELVAEEVAEFEKQHGKEVAYRWNGKWIKK